MDYGLTEEQVMIRDLCRQIAEEKIKPVREKYDEENEFPWEIVKVFGSPTCSASPFRRNTAAWAAASWTPSSPSRNSPRSCGGIALALAATGLGTYPILLYGSDEQKEKYLPRLASGESLAAFGLTEAEAGSDAGGIQTTAVRTATSTSSTAPSSGSPTAARPRSTRSSP